MELEILKTIIEKTLGKTMGTITEKTTFVDDLGIDSLDFFQILIDLEETYDIHIDQQEAEEIVTIGDAVETLRRATKGKRKMCIRDRFCTVPAYLFCGNFFQSGLQHGIQYLKSSSCLLYTSGAGDISGFQKIRKLGKTFILVPVF